eukprot:g1100.t1
MRVAAMSMKFVGPSSADENDDNRSGTINNDGVVGDGMERFGESRPPSVCEGTGSNSNSKGSGGIDSRRSSGTSRRTGLELCFDATYFSVKDDLELKGASRDSFHADISDDAKDKKNEHLEALRARLKIIDKVAERAKARNRGDSLRWRYSSNDAVLLHETAVSGRKPDVEMTVGHATSTVALQRQSMKAANVFSQTRLAKWERRRRKQEVMTAANQTTTSSSDREGEKVGSSRWRRSRGSTGFDSFCIYQDWELDAGQLKLERKVAAGSTSVVWRASYQDKTVAVKQPFAFIAEGGMTIDFAREVEVLSQLAHPYVLHFIGLCFKEKTACIVTEWYPSNVLEWLSDKPRRAVDDFLSTASRISFQIAQGMRYLHSRNVVHYDLKPSNVLLTSDLVPKVADYGLSRIIDRPSTQRRSVEEIKLGSPCYMAVELLEGKKETLPKRCDVYSYGMMLWAIFCGVEPFPDCRFGHEVVKKVVGCGARPPLDAIGVDIPGASTLRGVMTACWKKNPKRRPGFLEIEDIMRQHWEESR